MGLFSRTKRLDSLEDLFADQIRDLYDAEQRIAKALPKMAAAAHRRELREAFETHARETANQITRLEQVFKLIGQPATGETCEASKGLIAEVDEVIAATGSPAVKDAALIAAAQRVEHYEMAGYGCARTFAQQLRMTEAARLLQETLDEEAATDSKLTMLAEEGINAEADRATVGV
jgi:ferritin-like metal-binding protein YciE